MLIDASAEDVERWLPRNLGQLEPDGEGRTRLRATTDDPGWYVRRLAALPAPFHVRGSAPVRDAVAALSQRLARAAGSADGLGQ